MHLTPAPDFQMQPHYCYDAQPATIVWRMGHKTFDNHGRDASLRESPRQGHPFQALAGTTRPTDAPHVGVNYSLHQSYRSPTKSCCEIFSKYVRSSAALDGTTIFSRSGSRRTSSALDKLCTEEKSDRLDPAKAIKRFSLRQCSMLADCKRRPHIRQAIASRMAF